MNILIIGFGRAGKRHARLLTSMGITTGILDVNPVNYDEVDNIYGDRRPRIYSNFDTAVWDGIWDIAVIATPPDKHLFYIERCLLNNMWVSCEKPLTSFGRTYDMEVLLQSKLPLECVQVQYNYRFNPDMQQLNPTIKSDVWQFVATQYRPELPDWGLLLDHVSHDVDIIRWISKSNFSVDECFYQMEDQAERVTVYGKMSNGVSVYIIDEVQLLDSSHPRMARLICPYGYADATANQQMFVKMWEHFFENYRLGLPQYPGVKDALETQKILQDAFEKTVVIENRVKQ